MFFSNLDPTIIRIAPKTSTLKHQQHHLISLPLSDAGPKSTLTLHSSSNNHDSDLSSRNMSSRSSTMSGNAVVGKRPISQVSNGSAGQPFELTVRVQVNLPHNQKTAVRVKQDVLLQELFDIICQEVKLDKSKYGLIVPADDGRPVNVSLKDPLTKLEKREVSLIFQPTPPETKETAKVMSKSEPKLDLSFHS